MPILSSLYVADREVSAGDSTGILPLSLAHTRRIVLRHDQSTFTLNFAIPELANPDQTRYRYSLQRTGSEPWIERSAAHGAGSIALYSLSAGTYRLLIYAGGSNHEWSRRPLELTITVRPPLLLSGWFMALYILLALGAGYLLLRRYLRRRRRATLRRAELAQLRQTEELNQMKFRFFTNISHEFRTPLTLILTPLESLLHQLGGEHAIAHRLQSIHAHAQELLNLVNQLLDFRRLEMNGEQLNPSYGDIVEFVAQVAHRFTDYAAEQRKEWQADLPDETLFMHFDREKVRKMLNNLLSIAFKFTPEGGSISLRLWHDERQLTLEVRDTGCGIAPADLPHVFDRFYQARKASTAETATSSQGSGIGLHMVREYAALHQGQALAQSTQGKGSTFSIVLPLPPQQEAPSPAPTAAVGIQNGESRDTAPLPAVARKTLLIVEDHDELRAFLHEQLSDTYHILQASNGQEALDLARRQSPDLIVSDVMMPQMDGLELCRHIKTEMQTSHIPLILLTAHSTDPARTGGYSAGADSYIQKPFNLEMLRTRIAQLITAQDRRRAQYRDMLVLDPDAIAATPLDQQLLQRLLAHIQRNLTNEDYAVDNLAEDMNMSRSTLFRKIQSLTGDSPALFLRTFRLKHAATLLQSGQYTVSEAAARSGFYDTKYFSRLFKDHFHQTPTAYQHQH
jgi:signal transduction histidine kinase/CheY-like chemotaxis protein/AraC-like DNA-binding protein